MKKLFVLFAVATLFVGVQACKQKPADDSTVVVSDSTTMVTEPAPADTAAVVVADTTKK